MALGGKSGLGSASYDLVGILDILTPVKHKNFANPTKISFNVILLDILLALKIFNGLDI